MLPETLRVRRAFTLIELIVVVTLLTVAVGMIVPRLARSIGPLELREVAARLAQTARTVRELAVARQEELLLEFDLSRRSYRVRRASSGRTDDEASELRGSWLRGGRWPEAIRVESYRTPDGRQALRGTQQVWFRRDGTSSGASLRLAVDGTVQQVVIHANSGRVVWGDPRTTAFLPEQIDLGD